MTFLEFIMQVVKEVAFIAPLLLLLIGWVFVEAVERKWDER